MKHYLKMAGVTAGVIFAFTIAGKASPMFEDYFGPTSLGDTANSLMFWK
jgi:hypothetical protein